jgi:chaperonin GroEL
MSIFQTSKPKSASKVMMPDSDELRSKVLDTLGMIAKMAGATLGPGGKQVLIERPEMNMKPIITKDGVTVVKNLGFDEAASQLILEAARDAAIRTATEAGDGTTTATILSNSIAIQTAEVVRDNPKISPQRIVREMQNIVPSLIKQIEGYKIDFNAENAESVLFKVATLSANGDEEMAKAIMESYNVVGDEGNITIIELPGNPRFEVEKINGYTAEVGYELSCKQFSNGFINDAGNNMVALDQPIFLLYDGQISDISQISEAIHKLVTYFNEANVSNRNVVLCAHGFAETVIGILHLNWAAAESRIKIFPLVTEEKMIINSRTDFLYDLQAYTGSPVFNPIDRPLSDLAAENLHKTNRVKRFECTRFRSSIIADDDPIAVDIRVEELKKQKSRPESELELRELNLRIGKLTSGIAKLNIYAPSSGDLREKRDRAEDAWMAIRGATKHGALPGGCYALIRLSADLIVAADKTPNLERRLAMAILSEALLKPFEVLYSNYGWNEDEIQKHKVEMLSDDSRTYDVAAQAWIAKDDLLDSVPAVTEAIRNSVSIASLLGSIGGIVAFKRDRSADSEESQHAAKFSRTIGER